MIFASPGPAAVMGEHRAAKHLLSSSNRRSAVTA
uniref:Uncharacterized protein n=1 Tax=Arundo donax TaxID=35708 RepID=A0A0A8Y7R1_ARUDO